MNYGRLTRDVSSSLGNWRSIKRPRCVGASIGGEISRQRQQELFINMTLFISDFIHLDTRVPPSVGYSILLPLGILQHRMSCPSPTECALEPLFSAWSYYSSDQQSKLLPSFDIAPNIRLKQSLRACLTGHLGSWLGLFPARWSITRLSGHWADVWEAH